MCLSRGSQGLEPTVDAHRSTGDNNNYSAWLYIFYRKTLKGLKKMVTPAK